MSFSRLREELHIAGPNGEQKRSAANAAAALIYQRRRRLRSSCLMAIQSSST